MDEDGKVDGKVPIYDDLLAFLWCKMNTCPCETLINVVKSFYKHTDVVKARDLFFRRVPDSAERRIKHRKAEDILKGLYDLMQGFPSEDHPVFVAVDLNNLPFIELTNVDGAMLVSQQKVMKESLNAILAEQEAVRKQIGELRSLLLTPAIPVSQRQDGGGKF